MFVDDFHTHLCCRFAWMSIIDGMGCWVLAVSFVGIAALITPSTLSSKRGKAIITSVCPVVTKKIENH